MSLPWSKKRDEGGDTVNIRQDFIAMHDATSQSGHPLGNIPLVVLSKTPGIDDDDDYTPDQLKRNRDLQKQLTMFSTNSQHLVVDHSGHAIQLEEPDVVIPSILRVVDAAQHQTPLKNLPPSTRGASKSAML